MWIGREVDKMDIGAIIIIMLIAGLLVLTFYIIGIYNRILDAKNRVEDQFTQIDLEYNKIEELIPNIIEISKKYAKYEEKLINELDKANKKLINATSINGKINASNNLNEILTKIFNLKETYPELKSNRNFISLQKKLKEVEERIEYAGSFYNDTVAKYNNIREEFPYSIVAKVFKFKEINYIETN